MSSKRTWSAGLALALMCSCRDEPIAEPAPGAAPETSLLTPGALAPDFSALSQTGYQVSLGQLLEKPVAVYFCPGGLDSGCTALMIALRDRWLTLNQRLGMLLFVVPTDYNENRAHATRHELPFLVLADTTGSISRSYGLTIGSTPARPTGVLVGRDRRIQRVLAEPSEAEHVSALGRELP
jgi:peroxiredoxin Q/BCP